MKKKHKREKKKSTKKFVAEDSDFTFGKPPVTKNSPKHRKTKDKE